MGAAKENYKHSKVAMVDSRPYDLAALLRLPHAVLSLLTHRMLLQHLLFLLPSLPVLLSVAQAAPT